MTQLRPEVPACPECGGQVWEFHEDWSGVTIYRIDAAGWHEEGREGAPDSDWWWFKCRGCDAQWSTDDHDEDGLALQADLTSVSNAEVA
jgi:hypothetical protein